MPKKETNIREYQPKDYERLREVCFQTATGHYRSNKDLVAALYCEHYLEYESEHCFVVADKDDQAVGYIICAPDYVKYTKEFIANKFPKVKKLSRKEVLIKRIEFMWMKKIAKEYPAHLHIDILDDYQRMGLGHKLINKLMLHLDSISVPKLHLGCSAKNEKGVNFYRKFGFHEIKNIAGTILFGIDVADYVKTIEEKDKNV